MRKLLSGVDWVIVGIFLFVFMLLSVAWISAVENKKSYDTQCIKAGGTPVFNGEFRECFGVKSKGEH